ncbi:hypothetical protein ACIQNT_06995 [Streptomyces luteogriseus]|uniref:Putative metalloprotease n=1 Tax=Streptomyces luteogriseus TaxID=68233 RepID=A0A7W7GFY9_9ACTN|nr:hypothetical protein [Streptomyces luteogriseus]MBB4711619.1 putative metalloprotease [Streptomyces luteogriseus]
MTHQLRMRVCAVLAIAVLAVSGGYAYGAPARDDMGQDIETAVQGVDAYWDAHWSEFFTQTYVPPTVLGEYDGASADVPTCGGEPLDDDNAQYCATAEDYVAWDTDLMRFGYRYGDAFVYLVVAHEWGHAIQNRLDAQLQTMDAELQADCLAGAELEGAAQDGTVVFEAGDVDEVYTALVRDADKTPWTKEGDHGSASERVDAFTLGQELGVDGCLPDEVSTEGAAALDR